MSASSYAISTTYFMSVSLASLTIYNDFSEYSISL